MRIAVTRRSARGFMPHNLFEQSATIELLSTTPHSVVQVVNELKTSQYEAFVWMTTIMTIRCTILSLDMTSWNVSCKQLEAQRHGEGVYITWTCSLERPSPLRRRACLVLLQTYSYVLFCHSLYTFWCNGIVFKPSQSECAYPWPTMIHACTFIKGCSFAWHHIRVSIRQSRT